MRADSIVAQWVQDERIAGAVLLVSRGDEPSTVSAHGFAQLYGYGGGQYPGEAGPERLRSPELMTTATVFDLASVTKVMATTMALMLLVDHGALDLDASVTTYLPDFTGPNHETITPRHLLTHRSGLPQWLPVYYHADDADAAYAYVRSRPLTWPVGVERHYSDLGFMVLGRLVEAVAGVDLATFLHTELYGPLGLRATGFRPQSDSPVFAATSHGNPFERRMVHDPSFGYPIEDDADGWDDWRRYTLSGEVNDGNAHHAFRGVAGHAGLFSTADDLEVLVRLLLDGGIAPDGRRFLANDVIERFLTSSGEQQALGWQLPDYAPDGSFAHTGFTGTFVLGVPGEDLAVVLLTNRQNVGVDEQTAYVDVGPLQRAVTAVLTARPQAR